MTKGVTWRRVRVPVVVFALLGVAACADSGVLGNDLSLRDDDDGELVPQECSIPLNEILPGGPGKDGIPALTDPPMVAPGDAAASYLEDTDRIIGVEVGGDKYAIPLNIMWWHEIVNLNLSGLRLAVTHCPLTGSSMVFNRNKASGDEFGVSGLLYQNNLIMYNRGDTESLWPQMARGARCGKHDGLELDMYAAIEMEWADWRALYPNTRVVSDRTGFERSYDINPYGNYADLSNENLLFPVPLDRRRPLKERVLGVAVGSGGKSYPFGLLSDAGPVAAVNDTIDGTPVVILWSESAQAAMAFEAPLEGGEAVAFGASGGTIVDQATGSEWTVAGRAISGPMAGERLTPLPEAYVAYWFAWAVFQPGAALWAGPA